MSPTPGGGLQGLAQAHAAIERFLIASSRPVLLEPGEDHFPLVPGRFAVDWNGARLTLQTWDENRNLVRRVTGLGAEQPGTIELIIERFPRRAGRLFLIDLARPQQAGTPVRERRLSFRERFRRLLTRQFPSWNIAELTSELDLEHSLSACYPRALLRKGCSSLAAIGAPLGGASADGALTFGLIWLDYLRRRGQAATVEGLVLFLPQGRERTTCLRLRWLNPDAARWQVQIFSSEDHVSPADLHDYGNIDTRLEPFCDPVCGLDSRIQGWVERIAALPEVEAIGRRDGSTSLCVHGLEFARARSGRLGFGLARKIPARDSSLGEIERLARELARMRSPDAADTGNAVYRLQPERWIESMLRGRLEQVDASLLSQPLYGQVPAFAAGERGVLDLLAAERSGRLAVLEVKASEDIHLPLQALDYWMRVAWHLERGEFSAHGYFPGITVRNCLPRLLLIAPALDFHPSTETILRFFSPAVPVERIGLGVEWRRSLKVAFRIAGFESPC
jgi:hypothetical protein